MDLQEVKACLRALLSSTVFSYNLNKLLSDFRSMTGEDLPLFGCLHPVEFLRTLDDTVQLLGNPFDPEIALIESKKSSHITSLVDRQKTSSLKSKYPHFITKQRRLILPNKNEVVDFEKNKIQGFKSFPSRNNTETKPYQPPFRQEHKFAQHKEAKAPALTSTSTSPVKDDKEISKTFSSGPEKKVQADESQGVDVKKTDSCYFEGDVSDNESCFSVGGSRSSSGRAVSSPFNAVNDGMKNKLKQLIKQYPEGLWCCELPELFLKKYNYALDYREFGYTSLIQMLSELPDVFRCLRPGNEDWILFDASASPSPGEEKIMSLQSISNINREVRANLKKLLLNHLKNSSDSGIELNKIPELYEGAFGCSLDVQSLGFKDVQSFLGSWEESSLNMLKINGNIFVVPALKVRSHSSNRWEAVPPVTAENDLFRDIFPKDVVGPDEELVELDLYRHVAVGHVVEVCVAEVWSPTKFYVQLNKFKNRLNRFMDDLQKFYNVNLNKYKMPNSTIRPNQVCVGLYSSEPEFPDEWHRAQIVKVINDKTVLINFVDFGTVTRVKKTQLRFLHRSFQYFPVQAFLAELSGVAPPNDQNIWPMSTNGKFLEYSRLPYFKAEIVEIDFKKPSMSVILFDSFQTPNVNINKKLILEKLAWEKEPVNDNPFLPPESDEEESKPAIMEKEKEKEKKDLANGNSSTVQESLKKNLPNEFSDITDLDHSTLFYYQMKSLKLETSLSSQEKEEVKKSENVSVSFEFEDVPDLEKSIEEKEATAVKESTKNGLSVGTENVTKFIPPTLENKQILNPPSSSDTPSICQQNTRVPEANLSPNLKSSPPGLERANVFPFFPQTLFFMNPETTKKRINLLAMELLTKNASLQQVGINDPVLALKIATEMAETYIRFELSGSQIPLNYNTLIASSLFAPSSPMQANASEQRRPDLVDFATKPKLDLPDIMTKQEESKIDSAKPEKPVVVKKKNISGKEVHLIVLENKLYFVADEIVRAFTLITNREIADRVLILKKISIDYKILSKKSDLEALKMIKSANIPVIKNKLKKLKVFLVPVEKVVLFLQGLGCKTESFENEFLALNKTKEEKKKERKKDKQHSD